MREITRVLAVDPGPHTGISYWENRPSGEIMDAWEVEDDAGGLQTAKAVEHEIGKGIDVLVCEDFKINAGTAKKSTAGSIQTIETIGMLRFLADRHAVPFVLQSPADAVGFSSKEKMLLLGWWTAGSDHARSSTKHLILYLAKNGLIDFRRLMP